MPVICPGKGAVLRCVLDLLVRQGNGGPVGRAHQPEAVTLVAVVLHDVLRFEAGAIASRRGVLVVRADSNYKRPLRFTPHAT